MDDHPSAARGGAGARGERGVHLGGGSGGGGEGVGRLEDGTDAQRGLREDDEGDALLVGHAVGCVVAADVLPVHGQGEGHRAACAQVGVGHPWQQAPARPGAFVPATDERPTRLAVPRLRRHRALGGRVLHPPQAARVAEDALGGGGATRWRAHRATHVDPFGREAHVGAARVGAGTGPRVEQAGWRVVSEGRAVLIGPIVLPVERERHVHLQVPPRCRRRGELGAARRDALTCGVVDDREGHRHVAKPARRARARRRRVLEAFAAHHDARAATPRSGARLDRGDGGLAVVGEGYGGHRASHTVERDAQRHGARQHAEAGAVIEVGRLRVVRRRRGAEDARVVARRGCRAGRQRVGVRRGRRRRRVEEAAQPRRAVDRVRVLARVRIVTPLPRSRLSLGREAGAAHNQLRATVDRPARRRHHEHGRFGVVHVRRPAYKVLLGRAQREVDHCRPRRATGRK